MCTPRSTSSALTSEKRRSGGVVEEDLAAGDVSHKRVTRRESRGAMRLLGRSWSTSRSSSTSSTWGRRLAEQPCTPQVRTAVPA